MQKPIVEACNWLMMLAFLWENKDLFGKKQNKTQNTGMLLPLSMWQHLEQLYS